MFDGVAGEWQNGLHDALLRTLTIDYAARRATLAIQLSVGDSTSPGERLQQSLEIDLFSPASGAPRDRA